MSLSRARSRSLPARLTTSRPTNNPQIPKQPVDFPYAIALLDDTRTKQLFTWAYEHVIYTSRRYAICGSEVNIDPPQVLCEPCINFIQDTPPTFPQRVGKNPEFWRKHHSSLFQLIDCYYGEPTGKQTCRICLILWQGLQRRLSGGRRDFTQRTRLVCTPNSRPNCFDILQIKRVVHCPGWDGSLVLNVELEKRSYCIRTEIIPFEIIAYQREYKDSEDFALQHPLSDTTSSEQTFHQIRKWIKLCDEEHPFCRRAQESETAVFTPTRLIQLVPDSTDVRLIDTCSRNYSSQVTSYVALNYRWSAVDGSHATSHKSPRLMLNQITSERLRAGVPLESLPKTLRDACIITQRLGYRHIWIDSLCIFQDSPKDWSHEAATMATIYKCASITLAASCAKGEEYGCFINRARMSGGIQPLYLLDCPLLAPIPEDIGEEGRQLSSRSSTLMAKGMVIKTLEPFANDKDRGKLKHLADRGWTFQERLLSIRVLHFASEQVYWECRQLDASELYPGGSTYWTDDQPEVFDYGTSDTQGTSSTRYVGKWHELIEDYSARKLTRLQDRLLALAGLAQETLLGPRMDIAGERYVAGLWASSLYADLSSRVASSYKNVIHEYIAPSWSWASVQTKVTYADTSINDPLRWHLAKMNRICLKHRIIRNVYGSVEDGIMLLYGKRVPVQLGPSLSHEPLRRSIRNEDGRQLNFAHAGWPASEPACQLDFDVTEGAEIGKDGQQQPPEVFMVPLHFSKHGMVTALLLAHDGIIRHTETRRSGLAAPPVPVEAGVLKEF